MFISHGIRKDTVCWVVAGSRNQGEVGEGIESDEVSGGRQGETWCRTIRIDGSTIRGLKGNA